MSNRPLSPHLQVYKPQLTSVLSIMHRITGVVIALGGLAVAYWLWSAALGAERYECVQWLLTSTLGIIFLVIWTACTGYHLFNGIRHLVWDMGCGFELDQAYLSGKLVLVFTVLLTIIIWMV